MDLFNFLPPDLFNTNREPNDFELTAARELLPRIGLDIFALYAQIAAVDVRLKDLESYRGTLFNFISPDLLSTNTSELSAARAFLTSVDYELFAVYKQIAETEARLNDLISQRTILAQIEGTVRSIISPIRRVPRDILRHIFEFCVDITHTTLSAKNAPILLTHVSRDFRRIALGMPTLWTIAKFKIGRQERSNSASGRGEEASSTNQMLRSLAMQCLGMEVYLLRSGSLPLDVEIDYTEYPTDTSDETQELYFEMGEVVLAHHACWRDVCIHYHDPLPDETLAQLSSLTPDDLPLIRTLDLFDREQYDNISDIEFMPILACPTLKTVCGFRLDSLHRHTDVLRASFANLTTLTCTTYECSLQDIATTLQMCPSLVKLELPQLLQPDYANIDDNFLISLPSLEDLRVTGSPFSKGDSMVNKYFSAPKLKWIDFEAGCMYPSLVNFFKRSPSLISLRIDADISAELFIEALRCCPQLREIEELPTLMGEGIEEQMAYDSLFTRFVDADDAGDIVCPNLERILHQHQPIPILRFDTLKAFIVRKINPSPRLAAWKSLYVSDVLVSRQDMAAVEELLGKYRDSLEIQIEIKGCYDDMLE